MTMRLRVQQAQGGRQELAAQAAQTLRLDRGLLTIGRGADCDLVLQDTQVSRHHAQLRRYGDQWLLVDLGSTNGTLVGGTRLRPDEARPLLPGVPVQLGDTRLILEEEPPTPFAPPQEFSQEPLEQVPSIQNYYYGRSEGPESQIQNPLAWLARLMVVLGSALLIVGSLLEWIHVTVSLPLLGNILDQGYTGLDSGQAGLFIGVAVMALLLVVADVVIRGGRSGLVVGLGQALVGVVAIVAVALSVYRYYQAGTRDFLGISLVDVLTNYLSNQVHISIQIGVYLGGAGLVLLIGGGVLRLLVAASPEARRSGVAREPA